MQSMSSLFCDAGDSESTALIVYVVCTSNTGREVLHYQGPSVTLVYYSSSRLTESEISSYSKPLVDFKF